MSFILLLLCANFVYSLPQLTDTLQSRNRHVIIDADITNSDEAPATYDYRKKGVVLAPKQQESCNSGWAFSAVSLIETMYMLKYGKIIKDLSPQQLIDCDKSNFGCVSGNTVQALDSLVGQGLVSLESYPLNYNWYNDCKFNKSDILVRVTDYREYDLRKPESVKAVLSSIGPMSVSINYQDLVQVMFDPDTIATGCSQATLNHQITLVGYGIDEKIGDYWIAKNSWGTDRGDGFFKLSAQNGSCGIFLKHMVTVSVEEAGDNI